MGTTIQIMVKYHTWLVTPQLQRCVVMGEAVTLMITTERANSGRLTQ